MLVNDRAAAAGTVVGRGKMFGLHALAAARFVPGDVVTLLPSNGGMRAMDQVNQLHAYSNLGNGNWAVVWTLRFDYT